MLFSNTGIRFEKGIDDTETIAYQKGYHDGYTEGMNKALLTLQHELEMAKAQRSIIEII